MKDETSSEEKFSVETEYESALEQCNETLDEINSKIENGRIYDVDNEELRVKQWRAKGYLLRTKLKLLEKRSLLEFADEIEEIKAAEKPWEAGP